MPETIGGYAGRILHLDLENNDFTIKPLERHLVYNFIGGYGINLELARKLLPIGKYLKAKG